MNSECRHCKKVVLVIALLTPLALQGCSETAGEAPGISSSVSTMPVMLASSADFGCLQSGSRSVSRIIKIRNSSKAVVRISRWNISCECLTVKPSFVDVEPEKSAYIKLVFDPAKEGEGYVGNLRMSVDGFADADRVCTFDVPVSVVASEDIKHLDILRE